jgi:hypothetical protein
MRLWPEMSIQAWRIEHAIMGSLLKSRNYGRHSLLVACANQQLPCRRALASSFGLNDKLAAEGLMMQPLCMISAACFGVAFQCATNSVDQQMLRFRLQFACPLRMCWHLSEKGPRVSSCVPSDSPDI